MSTDNSEWLVIERTFDAPIELVWKMWAESEHYASWYGPMGASIPVAEMDTVAGGKRLICMEMQTPDGPMKMWFAGEFKEVVPNERLVYTESMSDENGTISDPDAVTEVIVELAATDGGTKMTMTHVGVAADSPGAMGWGMAIDKLADQLAS